MVSGTLLVGLVACLPHPHINDHTKHKVRSPSLRTVQVRDVVFLRTPKNVQVLVTFVAYSLHLKRLRDVSSLCARRGYLRHSMEKSVSSSQSLSIRAWSSSPGQHSGNQLTGPCGRLYRHRCRKSQFRFIVYGRCQQLTMYSKVVVECVCAILGSEAILGFDERPLEFVHQWFLVAYVHARSSLPVPSCRHERVLLAAST